MANLGAETRSSAKNLLDAWSESGPDLLSNDPERSMNRSIGLSVESDLVKRNPNAVLLLAILSLLPAGTTKENLHWSAPELKMSMILTAIATLSQAALTVENRRENSPTPVLFVIPVVQSFMQQQNRIAQEAHRTMEALIAFNWYRCETKANLEIADHAVMAAKASGVERYIASVVWCLGMTYFRLGKYDTSYNHMQNAYQLFNTLSPGDLDVESQRLGGLCGIDLVENARCIISPADEQVFLARDVEKKCAALSDDVVHGRSLLKLGIALNIAQQREEALHYLEHARTVFMTVGDPYDIARAYQAISWVHLDDHRLLDALDSIEEAWKYAELTSSQYCQMLVSIDLGKILFNNNRDAKASKHIEIALMNASYIGDFHQTGRALDYMGYGYLRRGNY